MSSHDGFVLSSARFSPTAQPSCSGLLTPPESPKSSKVPLPMPIKISAYEKESIYAQTPRSCFGTSEPEPQSADLSRVSETIYSIIEQVTEQKLAEAMGPLRLNLRRFDSENTDLQTQNDVLGYEVQRLEQQLHALQNISVTTSNNLELLSSLLAKQLSHTNNILQNTNLANHNYDFPVNAPPASRQDYSVQPQFCFERRSSKRQRYTHTKSRKSRLVNYMMSKWRTGGEGKE